MPSRLSCFSTILNSITSQSSSHQDHEQEQEMAEGCEKQDKELMIVNQAQLPSSYYKSSHLIEPLIDYQPIENQLLVNFHHDLQQQILLIEDEIDSLSHRLRSWSLQIFEFAEIAMHEFKTHDLISEIFEKTPGWKVTRHAYGMPTAVQAVFKHGQGGQTVGFNSEMDALPGIGHACGHPLICIAGIAAAMATAVTLRKTNTPGTVVLLGTPAEETIGGKIQLIEKGAYSSMDACLMIHPAPYGGLLDMLAISQVKVEYFGKNAHAAAAPWEGINALDAAVSAYNNVSALRQQIRPDERVHGVIKGSENWVSNVIPDYAWLRYDIRAPTREGMEKLKQRVLRCFKAAAESSGCHYEIKEEMVYSDLRSNTPLGREYRRYMEAKMGIEVPAKGPILGSTDFGNVSYVVPSLHPIYAIPTQPGQGNHTKGFTKAASTEKAHQLTLSSAKGIAVAGWQVLADKAFAKEVRKSFEAQLSSLF